MGIAQAGNTIADGANLAIQGVKPAGISAQGQLIWTSAEPPPWQLLSHALAITPVTTTAAIDTTGAILLIAVIGMWNSVAAISDSAGNSWTTGVAAISYGQNIRLSLAYCLNPLISTAHTFTFPGTPYSSLAVLAFSGPSAIVDQTSPTNNIYNTGSSVVSINPIAPTVDNGLIVAATMINSFSVVSIDSGFTITDRSFPGGVATAGAYLVQDNAATVAPSWTLNSALNNYLAAAMLSFKPT